VGSSIGCAVGGILALCAVAMITQSVLPASPVLLIYGFQPVPGFYPPQLWADIAQALSGRDVGQAERIALDPYHALYRLEPGDPSGRDVFISDYAYPYEPTVRDLRLYASRLAAEIAWITREESVDRIDLVAFSMGALVARSYIEADDFDGVVGTADFPDYRTEYRGDIGTLVTIAAPHHGAEFAALGPWYGPLPRQLDPESRFLALLNAGETEAPFGLNPEVRYVSLAGQSCLGFGCSIRTDVGACRRECVEEGLAWAGHDLVILMASARLPGAENVACIGMDHIEMRIHPAIVSRISALLDGDVEVAALFASPELASAASSE